MATNEVPDLNKKRLEDYINTESLRASAKKVVNLINQFTILKVFNVQCKAPEYNDNAWYIGFEERPDPLIINIKLTPANYFVEFRFPHYLDQITYNGLKKQNKTWMYAGHNQHGEAAIVAMIEQYIGSIQGDHAVGKVKSRGKSSAEKILARLLARIFPTSIIKSNIRLDHFRSSMNRPLELDIYIPDKKIAVEIQGPQHFGQGIYGPNDRQLQNDRHKKQLCKDNDIRLICINWEGLTTTLFDLSETKQIEHISLLINRLLSSGNIFVEWTDVNTQHWA